MSREESKQGKHSRILSLTKEAEVSKDVVSIQINIFSTWEAGKDYMLLVFSFWELTGTVFILKKLLRKLNQQNPAILGEVRGKIMTPVTAGFQGKKRVGINGPFSAWYYDAAVCDPKHFNGPIYNLRGLGEENLAIAKLFRLVKMKWDCEELWWDLKLGGWGTQCQMKFSADKYMVIDIRKNNLITAFELNWSRCRKEFAGGQIREQQ